MECKRIWCTDLCKLVWIQTINLLVFCTGHQISRIQRKAVNVIFHTYLILANFWHFQKKFWNVWLIIIRQSSPFHNVFVGVKMVELSIFWFSIFFSGWHISVYIKTYLKHLELPVLRDVLWLFFSFIVFSSMIVMKRIERNLRALPLKWSPEQRYLLSIMVLFISVVAKCMETRVLIVPGVGDNLLRMENIKPETEMETEPEPEPH